MVEASSPLLTPFDSGFGLLKNAVEDGRIPGGVFGMIDREGKRLTKAIGHAQTVGGERLMMLDTWFDLASLTKVIFTTRKILELAVSGAIDLDSSITTLIPDFRQYAQDCWERKVTFRQCLGHQTPFPAVEPVYTYGDDPDRLRAFVLQREWRHGEPAYSDINYILLGIALERLAAKRIREMDAGAGFAFESTPEKAAATEFCTWRNRMICGEVHDENCYALQGSGHAGLFGTVDAVLDYAKSLLIGNENGDPVVRLMRQPLSDKRTHGWERPYEGWSGGAICNDSVIGHTGFTGTGLWVDFDKGRAWTLLTNRVHPSRHVDSGIFALRAAIGDMINTH